MFRVTNDWTPDAEWGYPIIPAQRALGVAIMSDDATGAILSETIVLPNLLIAYRIHKGARYGEHILLSGPQSARQFVDNLREHCEKATGDGRTMEVRDPLEIFGAPSE